jgi:acylphosphatase
VNLLFASSYKYNQTMSTAVKKWEVWFSGKVQGVGFRYETLMVAKAYEVAGFVENLVDGRVYMCVEGEPDEVDSFLAAVKDHLSDYIRETEAHSEAVPRSMSGFRIRR